MVTLHYLFDTGAIPIEFKGVIPEICECGSPLILNDAMTQLSCSSSICPLHMAERMDGMLKSLGARDLGPATCRTIIEENGLVHHTQVMTLSVDQMPSRNKDVIKKKFYDEIHKVDSLPLAEIAKLLKAPSMQTRCDDIFNTYTSIDEFYKDFNYNESFISKKLGMKMGITTSKFTQSLIELEPILRGLCNMFEIPITANQSIVICMTGDVLSVTQDNGSSYRSREHWLSDLQSKTRGIVNIVSKKGMSQKVDYLVTDTPFSNTKKNKLADQYNKPKITFKDFTLALQNYIINNGGINV